jgi:hypothetical protein
MSSELGSITSYIKRAAQQTGFDRERYVEANVPEDFSKVIVVCFFGDFRAEAIFSSLILHQYIKKHLAGKYVILCSWQGHAGLFPYVDEFWSMGDQMALQDLSSKAVKFENTHKSFETIAKNLRKFFDVLTWDDMAQFYDDGLTKAYFDHFGDPVRVRPGVPAPKIEFTKELHRRNAKAIFIHPRKLMRGWNKREVDVEIEYTFWVKLTERLLKSGFVPVVYQNYSTYDISKDFGDKCIYVTDNNVLSLMSQMRATACVLDVFSGISRLAMLARCPFIAVDERSRYVFSKEYEINDLCINGAFPYRYILSFSTILQHGNFTEVIDHINNVVEGFLKNLDPTKLPSPSESIETVPYSLVRKHKEKKLGIRFIKVERLVI